VQALRQVGGTLGVACATVTALAALLAVAALPRQAQDVEPELARRPDG